MIDLEQAQKLEKEAQNNNGHCSNCGQTIKIYRYGISTSMVQVLKAMAKATQHPGQAIDADKLNLKHSERTQLTKMRFHGLIAKVKHDGRQVPRNWVITTKGWKFLGNKPVQAKVIIYENQVLGHDGGETTIRRIAGLAGDFEQEAVSEPEARAYSDVRTPRSQQTITATYRGYMRPNLGQTGIPQTLAVDRLQVGHPVMVTVVDTGDKIEYKDIAAFKRDWRVEA
jgi:hypothetical protein